MTTTSLQAHHFQIRAAAKETVALRENTGSSLRGAFVDALWNRFCMNKTASTCVDCPLIQGCPVSSLVVPQPKEQSRTRDITRPFAIRPPIQTSTLQPGETFTFGLTIFGSRLELFPYVVMVLHVMGDAGIGQRVKDNAYQRGRFLIEEIKTVNPLTGIEQIIQAAGNNKFIFPNQPITWADAEARATMMPSDQITLHLLTPLRIEMEEQIIQKPLLRPFIARLQARHNALAQAYGGIPFGQEERMEMLKAAEDVEIAKDETRWIPLRSYSHRQKRAMPISGLTGKVTYKGNLLPILPLLLWGTVIQAGKSATKGNGVYEIM
jgi:hypothetical protein